MCSVEGCDKPAKSSREAMCKMHYMRFYRNGQTEKKIQAKSFMHSGGYVLVPASSHPLSKGASHHYEHRMVYYDQHGEGPFACNWCGKKVTWDDLHIDHLDDVKTNNDVDNLVASCPVCNQNRGQHKIRDTWRKKTGVTAFGKTLTLNEWAEEIGVSRVSICWRLKNGWSLERALSEGRGKTGPKKG